jgi:hypothetical protein
MYVCCFIYDINATDCKLYDLRQINILYQQGLQLVYYCKCGYETVICTEWLCKTVQYTYTRSRE